MKPIFNFWGVRIYAFSLFAILAVIIVIAVLLWQTFMQRQLRREMIKSALCAIPLTIIIGKMFYIVGIFIQNPNIPIKELLRRLLGGGFVFYGGLIGFIISILIYARIVKKDAVDIFNFWVAYIPLLHGIGRIGCFFNGCCYGVETHGFFGITYPINGLQKSIFPVQLVEAVFCIALSIALFNWVKANYRAAVYFTVYPIGRFILEFCRGDVIRGYFWILSTSQWISIIIIIIVILKYKSVTAKTKTFREADI